MEDGLAGWRDEALLLFLFQRGLGGKLLAGGEAWWGEWVSGGEADGVQRLVDDGVAILDGTREAEARRVAAFSSGGGGKGGRGVGTGGN